MLVENGFCGSLGYGNKVLLLVMSLLVLSLESFEGQLLEVSNTHGPVFLHIVVDMSVKLGLSWVNGSSALAHSGGVVVLGVSSGKGFVRDYSLAPYCYNGRHRP